MASIKLICIFLLAVASIAKANYPHKRWSASIENDHNVNFESNSASQFGGAITNSGSASAFEELSDAELLRELALRRELLRLHHLHEIQRQQQQHQFHGNSHLDFNQGHGGAPSMSHDFGGINGNGRFGGPVGSDVFGGANGAPNIQGGHGGFSSIGVASSEPLATWAGNSASHQDVNLADNQRWSVGIEQDLSDRRRPIGKSGGLTPDESLALLRYKKIIGRGPKVHVGTPLMRPTTHLTTTTRPAGGVSNYGSDNYGSGSISNTGIQHGGNYPNSGSNGGSSGLGSNAYGSIGSDNQVIDNYGAGVGNQGGSGGSFSGSGSLSKNVKGHAHLDGQISEYGSNNLQGGYRNQGNNYRNQGNSNRNRFKSNNKNNGQQSHISTASDQDYQDNAAFSEFEFFGAAQREREIDRSGSSSGKIVESGSVLGVKASKAGALIGAHDEALGQSN